MGMSVVDPHSVDTQRGNSAERYSFEEVNIHDPETACSKEQGQAAQEKGKCWMMEVVFEKVVEVESETAEKCHDAEEQGVADKHHPYIVTHQNNDEKEQYTTDKHIEPEAEEALDKFTL